ncbi:MAG: matrixin family metalloprotease, partial [Phycisphaerae bacterium]
QATSSIPDANVINIGIGNMAAVGGGNGELGLGGDSYIPGQLNSLRNGFAWLDHSQSWDPVLGNGNVQNSSNQTLPDFYNVLLHEVGHALGLGHSDAYGGNMMNSIVYGERLGPSQDDIDGFHSLYSTFSADPTTDYTRLTRSSSSFTVGLSLYSATTPVTNSYNYFYGSPSIYVYDTNSMATTISGATTVSGPHNYADPSEFHLDGGTWTTGSLVIGAVNVNFGTAGSFTQSAGVLTVNSGGLTVKATGSFTQSGGTATVNGITVVSGATITHSGGTLAISGTQSWYANATLANTGGNISLNSDAGSSSSAPLNITLSNAATLTVNGSQHLKSLQLGGTSQATLAADLSLVLVTSSLTFNTSTSALDANNGWVLVHSTNPAADYVTLRGNLLAGYNNGAWNGVGIKSTSAATHAGQALGIMTGANFLALYPGGTFRGQSVSSSDILLRYTYAGDANFDGHITAADFAQIDANYLKHTVNPTWLQGDFNYDNTIDYKDFALIDYAFAHQSPGGLAAAQIAADSALFGAIYLTYLNSLGSLPTEVPEPATLSLLLSMGWAVLRRRKSA